MLTEATAARTRTIAASPSAIWEIVADPHHLPRWWPGVLRVEGVDGDRFTQVLPTARGRPVRADFTVTRSTVASTLEWEQQLAGTPFAGILRFCRVTIALAPGDAGMTAVTITQAQRLRGASLTGGWMLRRATRRRLDEALAGLAAVSVDPRETSATDR